MANLRPLLLLASVVTLFIVFTSSGAFCDDTAAPSSSLTENEIDKMNMKSLKTELRRRRVSDFSNFLEKEHFRAKLKEVVADPQVQVLSDEDLKQQQQQQQDEEQHKKTKQKEGVQSANAGGGGDFDIEMLKDSFRKKRSENQKLKEMLQKQGMDTSGMKFGGGEDELMEALFKDEDKKKNKKPSKKNTDL